MKFFYQHLQFFSVDFVFLCCFHLCELSSCIRKSLQEQFLICQHLNYILFQMIQTSWNFTKFWGVVPTSSCHFFHPSVCPYVRLPIRYTPYLRHSTSSDHNFCYMCKMRISIGVFFIFKKILPKGQKIAQTGK